MYQSMGHAEPARILVRGHDLCQELIGYVDFGQMVFLEIIGRMPTDSEATLTNAILVTLVEDGITPSAIASRLTHLGAPDALQGSVAAGLLGAGSVFLGTMEASARMLQTLDRGDLEGAVRQAVGQLRSAGHRVPGIGHPLHTDVDPRATRLLDLSDTLGLPGWHREALEAIQKEAERASSRKLRVNAAGAIGAVLSDMGVPWQICRGFALISRAAGLVGHLLDEMRSPIARELWRLAEESVQYRPPDRESSDTSSDA